MRISKRKINLFRHCKQALKTYRFKKMLISSIPNLFMKSKRSGTISLCIFYNLFLLYTCGGVIADSEFKDNFITIELDQLGFLKYVGHVQRPNCKLDYMLHHYQMLNGLLYMAGSDLNLDLNSVKARRSLIKYALAQYKFAKSYDSHPYGDHHIRYGLRGFKYNLLEDSVLLQEVPKNYTLCTLSDYGRHYIKENHLEPIFKHLKSIFTQNWKVHRTSLITNPLTRFSFPDVFILLGSLPCIMFWYDMRRSLYNSWKAYCKKNRVILPNVSIVNDKDHLLSSHLLKSKPFNGTYSDYYFINSRAHYLLKRDLCDGIRGVFTDYFWMSISLYWGDE